MNKADRVKINFGKFTEMIQRFWFFYFMINIAVVGLIFGYGVCAPLYLIGLFFDPARKLADRILCKKIRLLMDIQPWFTGTFDLNFPTRAANEGLLLVSNHRSTLEAFILLSRVEGVRIFTKKSLLLIPMLGLMMRMTRQIPAKRGNPRSFMRAVEIVRKRLRSGDVVHIFPEMTRCPEGFDGVQKFSSYPFLLAIQEKVKIVPIVFLETDKVWAKGKFALRFRHPIRVRSLSPIDAQQFSSAEALKDEIRRLIEMSLRGNTDDYSPLPVHSNVQQQPEY